ncbi:CPBP family intramembrane glutamic endopeptidase [Paenibacillus flagellatus]|uniref:CAAX prenyl protease 2/Lysostaphin resistance protein A-like domain-containing protein n=1 Tax=Paenibacillus flagellatus TaxID=2211139 RepID=A0A2V5K2Q9_9BACL|nr:CPBP family intramembrane glutamic endopeptidase [Paenibacillus flagellatus]PYI52902.1 hypothetical protein DLM86_18005 [Paenibacillus flagellatus]
MNMTKRALGAAGKIALAFVLAFVLTLAAMIPVVAIAGLVRAGDGYDLTSLDRLLNDPIFVYGSMVAQAIGFIGAVPLLYALFERKARWSVGWSDRNAVRELLKGAGFGIVLMTAIFLVMLATGAAEVRAVRLDAAVWGDLAAFLGLFALVALNEELFSRGYVQGVIRHRFGPAAAVVCSSLFFALLHAANPGALAHPLPLLNIFAAGLLLGLCRETTGSLWFPIGLHWTWNFVQGNVFGFEVSGTPVASLLELETSGPALWSGGQFGAEGSLIATAVMAIGMWRIRERGRRGRAERLGPFGE